MRTIIEFWLGSTAAALVLGVCFFASGWAARRIFGEDGPEARATVVTGAVVLAGLLTLVVFSLRLLGAALLAGVLR
jgi:hypothetical protein